MKRGILALLLAGGLLGSAVCSCHFWRRPRNVVIVVADALRRDHLGCYGYERDTSPEIDAFAGDATLFELAFAQSPSTKPSIASLFISKLPSQHKVVHNRQRLPSSHTTLAEVLKTHGYATAGFIENPVIGEEFGFSQGFDHWVSDIRRHKRGNADWGEGERRREAEKIDNFDEEMFSWIETHRDRKFFLYVHFIDPHSPYHSPAAYRGLFSDKQGPAGRGLKVGSQSDWKIDTLIDKYDEEIRYIDDRFGSLLDHLTKWDLMDRTVVIFLSDHGEGFKEHGFFHHSYAVFSEVIDIPLIIRSPRGLPAGKFPRPVQHIDLFPTILELVGIDPREYSLEGRSLVSLPRAEDPAEEHQVIISENLRRVQGIPQRAIIADPWKLIHDLNSGVYRLFDLTADPGDEVDLSDSKPAIVERLRRRLEGQLGEITPEAEPKQVELDPQLEESLRRLGYL